MSTILLLGVDGLLLLLLVLYFRRRKYHRNDVQYIRKVRGVRELNAIADQLDQLDAILTQIQLAQYHHLRGVTISLPDVIAGEHGHTLLINGHDNNTRALLDLVIGERDRLRELLDTKIQKLAADGTTQLTPEGVIEEIGEAAALSGSTLSPWPEIQDHRSGIIKREIDEP